MNPTGCRPSPALRPSLEAWPARGAWGPGLALPTGGTWEPIPPDDGGEDRVGTAVPLSHTQVELLCIGYVCVKHTCYVCDVLSVYT